MKEKKRKGWERTGDERMRENKRSEGLWKGKGQDEKRGEMKGWKEDEG